jgi:biopolymer transport protein ExbB
MIFSILLSRTPLAADVAINQRIWEFLLEGGIFMAFIAACSFIALTVTIHRLLSLRWTTVLPHDLMDEIEQADDHFGGGAAARLQHILAQSDTALGRIGTVALSEDHDSREEGAVQVEATAREEIVKLQTGLAALEVVITIAPLLGLLGTVSGLVSVFATLGSETEVTDPSMIAAGIAKALNTTIAGLVVAVPTVIVHSFLNKRIEAFAARLEVVMGRLLHSFHRFGGPALYHGGEMPSPSAECDTAGDTGASAEFVTETDNPEPPAGYYGFDDGEATPS